MKTFINPDNAKWNALIQRPILPIGSLEENVNQIIKSVQKEGDKALFNYAKRFDKCDLEDLKVSLKELDKAEQQVENELKDAIELAISNIRKFHLAQQEISKKIETSPGVICWRKSVGIERVGLYIPGGSAPLFSTVLMLAIPALIAGCKEIVLCTPVNAKGEVNAAILFVAKRLGISKVFKVGGAQAIAAMTFGTASIPKVYKIFGPGNQYVTKAKELVQRYGMAIDMPAGPSEVLVIADEFANPAFVAADLLSQAEHGPDSQVVLLTTSVNLLQQVKYEVQLQSSSLARREIIEKALENAIFISFPSLSICFDFSNLYAPEHLIINCINSTDWIDKVSNAGSVFLGKYSCESAGDYASGTNHTLPTNAYAKSYSGVSLDSFVKKISFQKIFKEGLKKIGPAIEKMAQAEGLEAHKNAVTLRLKS